MLEIALGLFLGKKIGVLGSVWRKLIDCLASVCWPQIYGVAFLCGGLYDELLCRPAFLLDVARTSWRFESGRAHRLADLSSSWRVILRSYPDLNTWPRRTGS
jgi:Na+/H+ antiporter NhaA